MNARQTSVLIIEPHPMMRQALQTIVTMEPSLQLLEPSAMDPNAFPFVTPNQDDVLFLPSKPDLILFSLGNPGLGELKTLAELRRTMPDAYILALTTDELPGQNKTALKHGAHAVITKSFSQEKLRAALRSIHEHSSITACQTK